ncbi:hypothetical protein DCAR_0729095 [Daucus carota subsp. sativus]|uniref:TF-B3 domain-containing protein n=1 Tax=Daucus carota subsp. sativus TaxID=79200 RepID=A0A161ZPF4_DAUCS|nr:hypothetical protein DCAR_0729095 [Daucus carota subsp. sativus]
MIGLSCKHVLWCVDCDLKRNEIRSLNRFKRYYGLKIFNLVQLDYVGDDLFIIRLFKETAFESKYPTGRANDVEWSKDWETLNRAQYVIDTSTLECEKAMASISFNACANRTDYAYLIFVESKFDEGRGNMILSPMWKDYYKHWEDGSLVVFKFLEKSWTIKIEKNSEVCSLGKGIVEFFRDAGITDGDFLVAFRETEEKPDCLRVCIYNNADHGMDFVIGLTEPVPHKWTKSFFKIVYEDAYSRGLFMVPFMVNEFYMWKLKQIKLLSVGGLGWGVRYRPFPGYIYNLEEMLMYYKLKPKETIIFTLNETDVLYGRVYQCNGAEIDYQSRAKHEHDHNADEWIWSFEERTNSGGDEEQSFDDEMAVDDDAGNLLEFTTCLTGGNVDKKTHGLFIPQTIQPSCGVWKRTQKIKFITEKGVWDIGITNTEERPRFSAGWNKFIRDNGYKAGQMLNFRLVEHDDYADFIISKV